MVLGGVRRLLFSGNRKYYTLAFGTGFSLPFGWYAYTLYNSNKMGELLPPWLTGQQASKSTSSLPHYPYVLVGGGTASYFAATTIRARDPHAKVVIIGEEDELPYNRSKLSKVLPPSQLERVPYEVEGFYPPVKELASLKHGGISLMRNTRVRRIDAAKQQVLLENGEAVGYDKCLVATGSRELTHPAAKQQKALHFDRQTMRGVFTNYRSFNDYKDLDLLLTSNKSPKQQPPTFAVIGGGLLGCELSHTIGERLVIEAAATQKSSFPRHLTPVTQIVEEPHVLHALIPATMAKEVGEELKEVGVKLLTNARVHSIRQLDDGRVELEVEKGVATKPTAAGDDRRSSANPNPAISQSEKLVFDVVLIDSGAEPRVELPHASGFAIDPATGSLMADSRMRVYAAAGGVAKPKLVGNVWAAGDVCSFYDPQLERRRWLTGWEHAQTTGRVAGENMTGGDKEYTHQAAFQALFGERACMTGVGEVDAASGKNKVIVVEQQQQRGAEATRKTLSKEDMEEPRAVAFYTDKASGRIVGALLFNVFGMGLEVARRLLADKYSPRSPSDYRELARLFELWPSPLKKAAADSDDGGGDNGEAEK